MSHIGRIPISILADVGVRIEADNLVTVKGPKDALTQQMYPVMTITRGGDVVHATRPNDKKADHNLHDLTCTLLHDMIVGVTRGFKKELDINGTGCRVAKEGNKLVMNLDFSRRVTVEKIESITIEVSSANKAVINGTDRQKVGQFAAEMREKHPPEPYKGKGIRYTDEVIRRKEGKTGVKKKRGGVPL